MWNGHETPHKIREPGEVALRILGGRFWATRHAAHYLTVLLCILARKGGGAYGRQRTSTAEKWTECLRFNIAGGKTVESTRTGRIFFRAARCAAKLVVDADSLH